VTCGNAWNTEQRILAVKVSHAVMQGDANPEGNLTIEAKKKTRPSGHGGRLRCFTVERRKSVQRQELIFPRLSPVVVNSKHCSRSLMTLFVTGKRLDIHHSKHVSMTYERLGMAFMRIYLKRDW
jgi:hypothetical protein